MQSTHKKVNCPRSYFLGQLLHRITTLILIATSAVLSISTAQCDERGLQPAVPNIVLILTDDQGYHDLSCYGSPVIETPNIDRMAAEGVRFTDYYAAAPICSPSRAAILTGCYPRRVGLATWVLRPDSPLGIHPDEVTLAELLKTEGYATACVGKWHVGFKPAFLPNRQGFDHYFGLLHNLDKFEAVHFEKEGGVPLLRNTEVVQRPADPATLTEQYTEETIRFIREHRGEPFFVYLAHTMAHVPMGVTERFRGKSKAGLYGDVIQCIDWSTGEILRTLDELGLDSRTVVIYTSDNGRGPGQGVERPLRGHKLTTWEGGIRVPCIIRAPGRVPAGKVCSRIVTAMDFYPTIAELAEAALPADRVIDGKSLLPLLADPENAAPLREAFFYHGALGQLAAVRSGRWKLHLSPDLSLYDLEADPSEQNNVIRGNYEIVNQLRQMAIDFQDDIRRNSRPAEE